MTEVTYKWFAGFKKYGDKPVLVVGKAPVKETPKKYKILGLPPVEVHKALGHRSEVRKDENLLFDTKVDALEELMKRTKERVTHCFKQWERAQKERDLAFEAIHEEANG